MLGRTITRRVGSDKKSPSDVTFLLPFRLRKKEYAPPYVHI